MQFPKFYLSNKNLVNVYLLVLVKRLQRFVSLEQDETWTYGVSDIIFIFNFSNTIPTPGLGANTRVHIFSDMLTSKGII